MLAVIRIKGSVGKRKSAIDTLNMLGLRKRNTLAILPRSDSILGMLKKVDFMITWGELSDELKEKFGTKKTIHLNPPRKGFKSIKLFYPKGDLGYRGEKINDLIKRMM